MNASVEMLGIMANGSSTLSGSMGSVGSMAGMQISDDGSRKIRKPYTITKTRESWTEQEHDKFLEALQLFDRDWKKIEAFVGSKTVIQIRSHAQKYFIKVQKNGTGEHVPPPRAKRKAAQPYPQKAPKPLPEAGVMGRTMNQQPTQSEPCFPRRGHFQSSSIGSNSGSWQHHSMPPVGQVTPDLRGDLPGAAVKPAPDFSEVYKFIGNVFDLDSNGHLKKLKEMAPIDRETVVLLMRNLSINLSNPDFEEHKLSLLPDDVNPSESRPAGSEYHVTMSVPAASACSDGADDDTAVSGQPAPNHLNECPDSDSHLDPGHRTRVMPSYLKGAMGEPQQRNLLQDGGSRNVGSVLPINPYPLLTSSRPALDMSPVGLHRTTGPYSHSHMAGFGGSRGFAMPMAMPALTAGVEGNLDAWWS